MSPKNNVFLARALGGAVVLTMALSLNVASSSQVMAADQNGLYRSLHFIACAAYTKDRKEPKNTGMNAVDTIYISGWLSGYNYIMPNTYNIVPDNVDSVMQWMDNFCKVNPKQNVEVGLLKLTDDLYPKRIQLYKAPDKSDTPPPATKKPKKATTQ